MRGAATLMDESESAVADAMRQAERYDEDLAKFADQPRVSFRIDVDRLHEYG